MWANFFSFMRISLLAVFLFVIVMAVMGYHSVQVCFSPHLYVRLKQEKSWTQKIITKEYLKFKEGYKIKYWHFKK